MSFILTLFLYQQLHRFTSTRKELEKHTKEEEDDEEENKVKHNFDNLEVRKTTLQEKRKQESDLDPKNQND